MLSKIYIITVFLHLITNFLFAQETVNPIKVSNDSIAHAAHLEINAAYYHSTTTGTTLEEKCLNKKLTAKCLVYHNDQWFTFRTTDAPVYYLVVKNQECRDINGVQVLVIDGCICQPETYSILNCVSFATQDDIYLELKGLKHEHPYIINLDGYLNDFCAFDIGISTQLPDFYESAQFQTEISGSPGLDTIKLNWKLNEELLRLNIKHFEIARRANFDKKFKKVGLVNVALQVKGDHIIDYSFMDTLAHSGKYLYKIIAVSAAGERFIVGEDKFEIHVPTCIILDLPLVNKAMINVDVFDGDEVFIGNGKIEYISGMKFNVSQYMGRDVIKVLIVITEPLTGFRKRLWIAKK